MVAYAVEAHNSAEMESLGSVIFRVIIEMSLQMGRGKG